MTRKWMYNGFFVLALFFFSLCYLSFFPGRYTTDSFVMYHVALGLSAPIDVLSPVFTLFWRVLGNYNFGPFILNYLLLLSALFLIYRQEKSIITPLFLLAIFLMPCFFLSYVFVWKDNALISVLLLTTAILIGGRSFRGDVLIAALLTFAIMLRVNALFAVLPIHWFYTGRFTKTFFTHLMFFLVSALAMFEISHYVTYSVIGSRKSTYVQQFYATDIAKINYTLGEKLDLPSDYLADTREKNIEKLFLQYYFYPSNDYFYYKLMPDFNPLLKLDTDPHKLKDLKKQWLNTVKSHFWIYSVNRLQQWYKNISEVNYIYGEDFNSSNLQDEKKFASKILYEPKNVLMTRIRHFFQPQNLSQLSSYTMMYSFSKPITYLILDNILLLIVLVGGRVIKKRELIISILLSGIFYCLGYLPILPAGDYRYFTWTVLTFWLSLGLYLSDFLKDKCKHEKKCIL